MNLHIKYQVDWAFAHPRGHLSQSWLCGSGLAATPCSCSLWPLNYFVWFSSSLPILLCVFLSYVGTWVYLAPRAKQPHPFITVFDFYRVNSLTTWFQTTNNLNVGSQVSIIGTQTREEWTPKHLWLLTLVALSEGSICSSVLGFCPPWPQPVLYLAHVYPGLTSQIDLTF